MGRVMGIMENDEFFKKLDDLILASWLPMKEFLDVLIQHEDELDLQVRALVIGGLGSFVRTYAKRRADHNPKHLSFLDAIESMQKDERVQLLNQMVAERFVDSQVEKMGDK